MDEKTETNTNTPTLEQLASGGAIASIPKNALGRASEPLWTRERIDLIKKQICPAGITDGEFSVFLEKSKRSGLDPLMGECFCVPRTSKVKMADPSGRIDPTTKKPAIVERFVTLHVFQAAEQGMEVRAHRAGDFIGIRAGAIYENDECAIDFAQGEVVHRTNVTKARGKLLGAWAIASRRGVEIQPVAHCLFSEYNQGQSLWTGKPETMIVKCARAQALRLAYPAEFGGVYTAEEMASAIYDTTEATPDQAEHSTAAPPASSSKTDQLESFLAKKGAASRATVDGVVTEATGEAPPPKTAADPNRPAIITPDGKTKWVDEATVTDLENAETRGAAAVLDPARSPEAKAKVLALLEQVRAELKKRAEQLAGAFGEAPPPASPPTPAPAAPDAGAPEAKPPEPGSEG